MTTEGYSACPRTGGTEYRWRNLVSLPENGQYMRALLRAAYHAGTDQIQRFRYARLYTDTHSNLDFDRHIEEALGWIQRAQDSGSDRGAAYGARFGDGFEVSYPETTGYIIPTLLKQAQVRKDPALVQRAREMGDWEALVQMPSGAVMAGKLNSNPRPAIFNTGQVLLGWSALYNHTRDARYLEAARKAADWMVSMQEPDGNWIRGNSPHASGTTLYNVKAAWGLLEYGLAANSETHIRAAVRNAEYTLDKQRVNGWFEDCCLTDAKRPLLHTIAYTMQGLLEIGIRVNDSRFIAGATRCADSLAAIMAKDGFIPGRLDENWNTTVDWCCLTGSAQTSICWWRLYRRTGRDSYREAGRTINRYLMARHDISSPRPEIRGGVAGSWPVWGGYGTYQILNWAVKFFIDALQEEKDS